MELRCNREPFDKSLSSLIRLRIGEDNSITWESFCTIMGKLTRDEILYPYGEWLQQQQGLSILKGRVFATPIKDDSKMVKLLTNENGILKNTVKSLEETLQGKVHLKDQVQALEADVEKLRRTVEKLEEAKRCIVCMSIP